MVRLFVSLCLLLALSACGGGSSESPQSQSPVAGNPAPAPAPEPYPDPPPTPDPTPNPAPDPPAPIDPDVIDVDAARLLQQATFGVNQADIERVVALGMEGWIDEQMQLSASSHLSYLIAMQEQLALQEVWRDMRMEAWWQASVRGQDQLRQRVAFALSEIFVVSDRSAFGEDTFGLANYYDLLAEHAFGNYRDLLEAVTRSPIMGMYLSMLGNQKPNAERNIRPDENYAREVMQLFSIGLVELNQDGSEKRDADGNSIATYNQDIIKAYAHVYTGWNFAGTTEETWWYWWDNYETLAPMDAVEAFHDKGEKRLLNNVIVPAGQTAYADLIMAMDSLFMHDNVGPFIGKQLIQKLVTSNPSADYIARVSAVFNDNGDGIRGDLGAVVKAIILDEEARYGHIEDPFVFGKLREPLLKATHLWRAFNAESPNDRLQLGYPDYFFNQAPLSSPSVFNFFSPGFAPQGDIANQSLVAPEFQIATENFVVRVTNFMAYTVLWGSDSLDQADNQQIVLNLSEEMQLVDNTHALLDRLDLLLMAGSMDDNTREVLADTLAFTQDYSAFERVTNLIFLIMSSPQYSVQK